MSQSVGPYSPDMYYQYLTPEVENTNFTTEWPFSIKSGSSYESSPSFDESYTPLIETPELVLTVSTAFYLGADLPFDQDVAILSKDNVYFYVNSNRILAASINGFNGLLSKDREPSSSSPSSNSSSPFDVQNDEKHVVVVASTELSAVLNILLHVIFEMPCAVYAPTFEHISEAIGKMHLYGLHPSEYLFSSSPLFSLLLSQAPLHPIEVYALASQYSIEDLAVSVSTHLLSYQLHKVDNKLAAQMGSSYLRRLFWMHLGRISALKSLLFKPPYPHAPTPRCSFNDQKQLSLGWSAAAAHIAWDSRPDTSNNTIKSAFASIDDGLSCDDCKKGLSSRLNQVVIGWSQTKCTI